MSEDRKSLGELCSFDYGASLPAKVRAEGNVSVVGSAGHIGWHHTHLVTGPGIVIGRKGTVGKATWVSGDFWPIDTTYYVRPRDGVNLRWLYFLLDWIPLKSLDSATGVPGLNRNDAYRLHVRFFPREIVDQKRIADILDAIDDAIIETDAAIAKLGLIREGLTQDLLKYGILIDGSRRGPDAVQVTRIGLLPKDWEIRPIGQFAEHVGSGATPRGGKDVYTDGGVLFVRSQNVHFDGLRLDDHACISEATHNSMAGSRIFSNDVLLNITGASIGRCCAFVGYDGVANVNQHVCAIRVPNASISDALFLSACLASDIGQRQVKTLIAGGSREGLNFGHVRSIIVPWPRDEERKRIASVLTNVDGRLSHEKMARSKLKQLRDGLCDDVLTGRVSVSIWEQAK